jgi:hypothetical protein
MNQTECNLQLLKLLVKFGRLLLPEEKHIDSLITKTALLINFTLPAIHPQAPADPAKPPPAPPCFPCPVCGKIKLIVRPICPSCLKSEGGKFNTLLTCGACAYESATPKFLIQVYKDFKYDFKQGFKATLGIQTHTDGGLK